MFIIANYCIPIIVRVIGMLPYNANTQYIFVNRRGIIDVAISSSIVVFTIVA